jgi:polyphosphate kinase
MMTADQAIGEEANEIFNKLSMGETVQSSNKLLIAPNCLQSRLIDLMDNEIARAQAGLDGYIGFKVNSLTDRTLIEKMIEASQAGVKIDLVIRGICCLVPGVPGYTENIRVISIVGRLLEHSRISSFVKPKTSNLA